MTLTVVCWKWTPPRGYRSHFPAYTVNALARMVARHYPKPHRIVCVTDDARGIDDSVTRLPLWDDDLARMRSPHGVGFPACYRRLRLFHPDAGQWFGERFVSIDLDVVLTGDMTPVWDRPEAFVGWQDPYRPGQLCGSMLLMSAGARPGVWSGFDPATSPDLAKRAGYRGSDQAWISYCLPDAARWTAHDGVLSYRRDVANRGGLPGHARAVMFHGRYDPWTEGQRYGWVRRNWGRVGDYLNDEATALRGASGEAPASAPAACPA